MGKILAKIKGFFYMLWCFFSIAIVVVVMSIVPKKNYAIRKIWARIQRPLIGYKLTKIGEFDPQADMIMINHKSMLDIIILEEFCPKNLAWVAKKEIGDMRFFGRILSLPKMIEIDRQNPRSIVSLVKESKNRLEEGRVIAIFPEGTRGRSDKILRFHGGAKVLAEKLNLKVQPIVLKDTLHHLDVKNLELRGGEVKMKCLELCDLSDPEWYKKARADMQEAYDSM
ncbi:MAG: 1-acyl-sn-glycerol-3-phosphate acyltransferase [Campylobacteraceae bacterium]|nr:1-acyl-sn-glycerol-3-phosphate acyltransferase [Campylobacteraceae bacterium]